MDPKLRQDPLHDNFVTVYMAFQYVGKQLQPYTKAGLQRVHKDAYRIGAGHKQCSQQCSLTHGRQFAMWCTTCKTWRNKLQQNRRGMYNGWETTESWNWGTSYEAIVSIYLPKSWTKVDIKEFGTSCQIWNSCTTYNIGHQLLKKLRDLRNKHCGHNSDLKVSDTEKTKVFDTLKMLILEPDVQHYINVNECLKELDSIAQGDKLHELIKGIGSQLENVKSTINSNIPSQSERISKVETEIRCYNDHLSAVQNRNKRILAFSAGGLVVFVGLILIGWWWIQMPDGHPGESRKMYYRQPDGCLSEMFSYPFEQDLPLLPYIKDHSALFGREWLFKEIESYIRTNQSSKKGVLITAGIGYGKSAFVKEMLCATRDSFAYGLRSKVAAFHLCKFDVPSTKDPVRFIKRLVGFLSTRFPEFGGILSTISEHAILYDDEKCRKEIIACFDQGIINPLSEMSEVTQHQLIVVDALDECFDTRLKDNELHKLLNARYRKMPGWIKFIVASRKETRIVTTIRHLNHFHLSSHDPRNIDDIKQFIESKRSHYPVLSNFSKRIDMLLHSNEGNFLFVIHFINYLKIPNAISEKEFPESLADVYEINFERVFPSFDEYEYVKPILEIIVASLHPLIQNEVVYILETLNVSSQHSTRLNLEKISFCFRPLDEITFIHQSWQDWLLSEDNELFQISQTQGHSMFARYLLHQQHTIEFDIVDIAIHIGNANDPTLKKAFGSIFSHTNVTKSTLHKLVWKSESVTALALILNLKVDVDSFNEGNVTPSFIASARGHLGQLQILQMHGANLNFKVNDSYLITSENQIELIQRDYYFGYGLIHIATQFGHYNIVKYLAQQNAAAMRVPNGLGISIIEMACANGHIHIFRLLLESKSDVGHCLFYAATNGHTRIVEALIRSGISSYCITEDEAVHALKQIKDIDFTNSIWGTTNGQFEVFSLQNVWWIASKETPLHAAIIANFEDTAVVLIKAYPNLIECVNANGMTPFLLSVVHERTLVFKELIERAALDRCSEPSITIHRRKLECPVGGGYAHLDGIYRRFELTKALYKTQVGINWLLCDRNFDTAVHYAACSGNILFLYVIERRENIIFSDIRSRNYSTPYHSAAICGSYISMHVMTDDFKRKVTHLIDKENRTVMSYIALREFDGHPASSDRNEQKASLALFARLLQYGVPITTLDIYKRNFLHYAFKNGHYNILQYMFSIEDNGKINTIYSTILTEEDSDGQTPVSYAIGKGAYWNGNRHLNPRGCLFYDIFFIDCAEENNFIDYVNSWEAGLITALQTVPDYVKDDFISSFKDIIYKSPYLVTAMLVFLKRSIDQNVLRMQFVQAISDDTPSLSVIAVARHTPTLFATCGHAFLDSPHHILAYKYRADILILNDFLHLAFGSTLNKQSMSCADRRGYNCFHYALMGGNIQYAMYLLRHGVTIKSRSVSFKDIIWMMLLGKQRKSNIEYEVFCSDQLSCMDYLLGNLLKKNLLEDLTYSDLCLENRNSLSLIHVLAASGLNNTMNVLHHRFGSSVLFCRNNDMVTPLYLWNLLNRNNSIEALNLTSKRLPYQNTEEMLILGLLNDFPSEIFHECTLRCLVYIDRHPKIKQLKCFALVENKIRKFYLASSRHRLLQNNQLDALYISVLFEYRKIASDWFYLRKIEMKNMLNIKIYAAIYYTIFLEIDMAFNYPVLKQMFSPDFDATACDKNNINVSNIYCIRLSIEMRHMLKRARAYVTEFYIQHYIHLLKSIQNTVAKEYVFINERMITLGFKTFGLPLKHRTCCDSVDQLDYISKHRYLDVLKRTVKYQYFKESINQIEWDVSTVKLATHVPKPFEDIMQYLNTTSYANILDIKF